MTSQIILNNISNIVAIVFKELQVYRFYRNEGSRAVDGKRFLESNASSIPGTYFRLV